MNVRKPRSVLLRKKTLLLIGLIIVLVIAALELTNTTHFLHKKTVPQTIPVQKQKSPPATKDKKTSSGTSGSSATQSTTSNTKVPSSTAGSGSSAPLVQPYGDFVSNHRPGQNGSNTQEISVCDTTPGATCYIQFTNTSTNKVTQLPAQTVASDGSTTWTWNANTLTSGEWQIKAVASSNNETKTSTDSIKLVVP